MKDITAKLNNLRISPRKAKLVADLIKGKKIEDALAQLEFSTKRSSPAIIKLLKSAVNNAKNDFGAKNESGLYIQKITVDEGQTLKRYRPVSRGMSHPIKKRTSKITVVLSEKAKPSAAKK